MSRRALRAHSLRWRVTAIAAIAASVPIAAIFIFACTFLRDSAMQPANALSRSNIVCVYGEAGVSGLSGPDGEGAGEVLVTPGYTDSLNRWGASCAESPGGLARRGVEVRSKTIAEYLSERAGLPAERFRCGAWYISYRTIPELRIWPFSDPDTTTLSMVWDTGERKTGIRSIGSDGVAAARAQRSFNKQILLVGSGAVLLVALFTAVIWLATGRMLRPVEAIRRQLADITEQDLTRWVPVPRGRNELTLLATTVNATLDRLAAAVEDNRRFVADASHELRGPIAALRAELEIATAHPGLTDWAAVVDAALADTYRLQELATDLLLLARLDHTPVVTGHSDTVDLTAVVREQTARRRTRHVLTTDLPGFPTLVRGSRTLLGRLLGNLLDNAERHATTTITVRITTTAGHATLDVIDNGPGIPPHDRERIFDRFTRLDHARTRDTGGTGLGLSIARRIATVHGGTLHAADHPDGTRLTAVIPLDAEAEAGPGAV